MEKITIGSGDMIDHSQEAYIHKKTGRLHVGTRNTDPTMTQQQFKEECDINNIVKKYERTGEWSHVANKVGQYGDFSEIGDFNTMHQQVINAQEAFMALPADVRLRFKNNPGELISFLQDENNYDEGVKLGLIEQKIIKNAPEKTNELNEQKTSAKDKHKYAPKTPIQDSSVEDAE